MNNNEKPSNNYRRNFTGSIDELLEHVSGIDVDKMEKENTDENILLPDEEHIDEIMEEFRCNAEEAAEILQIMKEEHVKECLENMVEKGLLEIADYGPDGEPRYISTELGLKLAEEAKKRLDENK